MGKYSVARARDYILAAANVAPDGIVIKSNLGELKRSLAKYPDIAELKADDDYNGPVCEKRVGAIEAALEQLTAQGCFDRKPVANGSSRAMTGYNYHLTDEGRRQFESIEERILHPAPRAPIKRSRAAKRENAAGKPSASEWEMG